LEGAWNLARTIRHAGGGTARFEGRAVMRRSGHRLIHEEEGLLTTGNGAPIKATRTYIWRKSGDRLECLFEDGRPFHAIPLGAVTHRTVHLCPPDRYEVAYDFTDPRNWTSIWTVEGPQKDYVMENRFTRAL